MPPLLSSSHPVGCGPRPACRTPVLITASFKVPEVELVRPEYARLHTEPQHASRRFHPLQPTISCALPTTFCDRVRWTNALRLPGRVACRASGWADDGPFT